MKSKSRSGMVTQGEMICMSLVLSTMNAGNEGSRASAPKALGVGSVDASPSLYPEASPACSLMVTAAAAEATGP